MNEREKQRIKRLDFKASILTHYGKGKCACIRCGFTDIRALSIDHIEGNGAEHRKTLKGGSQKLYRWLFDNDFPEGYQTLCLNCQFIKSYGHDIPMAHAKSVAKRVRLWVEVRQQPFYIRDVMIGLGLPETQRGSVRAAVNRLNKAGVITTADRRGHYKKCVKPVKIFNRDKFNYI